MRCLTKNNESSYNKMLNLIIYVENLYTLRPMTLKCRNNLQMSRVHLPPTVFFFTTSLPIHFSNDFSGIQNTACNNLRWNGD